MEPKTVHSVFFSPTGTSRAITRAVSRGMSRETASETALTQKAPEPFVFSPTDVVVVGMPVYGGRLPQVAVERFQSLEGRDTPTVAVVVYGNRAYEDALAELCDLCTAQGFKLVSAAAFVGQHSFSSEKLPIAHGRPDRKDLDSAKQFGIKSTRLLKNDAFLNPEIIPGNRPYKPAMQPLAAATATDPEPCSQCGSCASSCPVQCIEMVDGMPQTWQEGCIWCMACVQRCPTGARTIILPKIHESAQRLHSNCQIRKEPEIFQPQEK
ncbi:MAG: EFR1 family ferrodoxin [Verrucomicrobiota bacterium]|nr:EFR1 family ferrodoxin [Verrucomicrobiota bacterium]